MAENPQAVHESIRDLTADQRDALTEAIHTVGQRLPDREYDQWWNMIVLLGWVVGCEDCASDLYPAEQGQPCDQCDHVNGDPATGSTPDDRPMRVCDRCWENRHALCDGGDPHDLEHKYCNCARLYHPPVTVSRPGA